VNNLPRVAPSGGTAGNRTRNLLITNSTPYHYATKPHNVKLKALIIHFLPMSSVTGIQMPVSTNYGRISIKFFMRINLLYFRAIRIIPHLLPKFRIPMSDCKFEHLNGKDFSHLLVTPSKLLIIISHLIYRPSLKIYDCILNLIIISSPGCFNLTNSIRE